MLDGGLATELERRGAVLDSALWSAKLLLDDPDALTEVHRSFLEAGADCISTATYQASFEGFERKGVHRAEAERLMLGAVALATRAVDDFFTTYQVSVGLNTVLLRKIRNRPFFTLDFVK